MAYALASSNICTKWEHSETSINIVTKISNSKEEKKKEKLFLHRGNIFKSERDLRKKVQSVK